METDVDEAKTKVEVYWFDMSAGEKLIVVCTVKNNSLCKN